jgi:site-specific DNA-methyltransferase (adenine-specific)
MEGMKKYPDKYFELAIVDPPYGIGEASGKNNTRGSAQGANKFKGTRNTTGKGISVTFFPAKEWDKSAPDEDYFKELRRVSKNQIIWGANHFISKIPFDSSCWIVWDKDNGETDFADCELAWTSLKTAVRKFEWRWNGMLQGDMKNREERIHPTQKPVALYKWLLSNYAKEGDKILDTHLGSGSSRIAAYVMGFDFYGFELDRDYYLAQEKRFKEQTAQQSLFGFDNTLNEAV